MTTKVMISRRIIDYKCRTVDPDLYKYLRAHNYYPELLTHAVLSLGTSISPFLYLYLYLLSSFSVVNFTLYNTSRYLIDNNIVGTGTPPLAEVLHLWDFYFAFGIRITVSTSLSISNRSFYFLYFLIRFASSILISVRYEHSVYSSAACAYA